MSNENEALIFIPDISGFTNFVNKTELQHSQHIITELLEVILDANDINLEVSEIEGDAVLFFRFGTPPSLEKLVKQSKSMFIKFHEQLKLYERDRICQCGACATANKLSLKFVVHFGETSKLQVKEHSKLIGTSVIVAHKLLKNNLENDEYVLLTSDYINSLPEQKTFDNEWPKLVSSKINYEDIGDVEFHHFSLTHLLDKIAFPAPRALPDKFPHPITVKFSVDTPMVFFHKIITDIDLKPLQGGVKEVNYDRTKIPRVGSSHECILPNGTLDIKAIENKNSNGVIEYGESIEKIPVLSGSVNNYFILKEDGDKTQVTYEFHYKPVNFFDSIKYSLFKLPLKLNTKKIMANIKNFAETSYKSNGFEQVIG